MLYEKFYYNLIYFVNIFWGKKGFWKLVFKFFFGKREGSIRWSLLDEVWIVICKDSYYYRVGFINNINEILFNMLIFMWDLLEVFR